MSNTFLIADTHFSHRNIIGLGGRPFRDIDEMNEMMVSLWNAAVKEGDTVYHLGDFSMWKPETVKIAARLNGKKYLIKGNHDNHPCSVYTRNGFEDIIAYKEFRIDNSTMVCTHVPVHRHELARWKYNIHGHIHQEQVRMWTPNGEKLIADPHYLCVSVEQTLYAPVSLETVKSELRKRGL